MKFKRKGILLSNAILMFLVLIFGLSSCTLDKEEKNVESTITADGIDYNDGDVIDMPENVVFRYDGTDRASSLTLKATVLPESVTNKKLTWSLVWADGGSHGTTSSYVSLTPSSDTLSCTVSCKQGFNYQLKVVVSSSINSNVNASCTLDYEYRFLGIDPQVTVTGVENIGFYTLESFDYNSSYGYVVDLSEICLSLADSTKDFHLVIFDESSFSWVGTTGNKSLEIYVYWELADDSWVDSDTFYGLDLTGDLWAYNLSFWESYDFYYFELRVKDNYGNSDYIDITYSWD